MYRYETVNTYLSLLMEKTTKIQRIFSLKHECSSFPSWNCKPRNITSYLVPMQHCVFLNNETINSMKKNSFNFLIYKTNMEWMPHGKSQIAIFRHFLYTLTLRAHDIRPDLAVALIFLWCVSFNYLNNHMLVSAPFPNKLLHKSR